MRDDPQDEGPTEAELLENSPKCPRCSNDNPLLKIFDPDPKCGCYGVLCGAPEIGSGDLCHEIIIKNSECRECYEARKADKAERGDA